MIKEESNKAEQTQVVTQMELLGQKLNDLEAAFNTLEDRLISVLRIKVKEEGEIDKVEDALVPFAIDIRIAHTRIGNLNHEILSVLGRLEI